MSKINYQTIELKAHERPVHVVKFNIDGDMLITASDEGELAVWDAFEGEELYFRRFDPVAIRSADITSDSKFIAIAQNEKQFVMLEWETDELKTYPIEERGVRHILFSKNNKRLFVVTAKTDGKARIIIYDSSDIENLKQIKEHSIKFDSISALLSADDEFLWLGTVEGELLCFDSDTFDIKYQESIDNEIHDLSLFRNAFIAASCSDAKCVSFYSEREMQDVMSHYTQHRVMTAHVHPFLNLMLVGGGVDAQKVATCGNVDETLITQIYDLEFKEMVVELKLHGGLIQKNRWSPEGLGLASGSWDGTVMLLRFDEKLLDYKYNTEW